jgi:hypothetical protein
MYKCNEEHLVYKRKQITPVLLVFLFPCSWQYANPVYYQYQMAEKCSNNNNNDNVL